MSLLQNENLASNDDNLIRDEKFDKKIYKGKAKQMAEVVDEGLQNGSFFEMNQQLAKMFPNTDSNIEYIFTFSNSLISILSNCIIGFTVIIGFIYFYLSFITINTFIMYEEHKVFFLYFGIISIAIIIVQIIFLIKIKKFVEFHKRMKRYKGVLDYKQLELIDSLEESTGYKTKLICTDLKRAVNQKLIPQGHFSRNDLAFMISDEIFYQYEEKPEIYDRYFQKKLEEKKRVKSRTEFVVSVMQKGDYYIKKLNDHINLIQDNEIRNKVENIRDLVGLVFLEVDKTPKVARSLGVFINYYLPTLDKLLDTYVDILESSSREKNILETKKQIEETLEKVTGAFEGMVGNIYEDFKNKISNEIETMEMSMKEEGLLD